MQEQRYKVAAGNITRNIERRLAVLGKSWEGLAAAEYETAATTRRKAAGRSTRTLTWLLRAAEYMGCAYWEVDGDLPQPIV